MKFQFSLQPVLCLHASYERMEQLRLLTISAAIVRLRQEISAIDQQIAISRRNSQATLASGVVAAELHFALLAAATRLERKRGLQRQLADLEKKHQTQRSLYYAARQRHQTLQNLRDQRLHEFRIEAAREEQRQLDELFLLRHGNPSGREPE
jgi:flagellar export protein FliJ